MVRNRVSETPEQTDASLIERAQGGDEEAFHALFRDYEGILSRRISRLLPANAGRKVSVADLMQEIRIAAYKGFPKFEHRGEGSLRNWLLTIADHHVQSVMRRFAGTAKRDLGREVTRGARPETAQHHARGASPSAHAIGRETAERIRRALASLSDDHRTVIRLVRDEGLSLREAAESMGRSREAAKKLYGRALVQLKSAYDRLAGENGR